MSDNPHLSRWLAYMKAPTHAGLFDMLHEDAVFESPVVHTPQRGRDLVFAYLASADEVLGGEGFEYLGHWLSDDGCSAVLEFRQTVDGILVNGVDMIRWDEAGRIVHFKVMVRPLKAIQMVHQKMGEALAAMKAGARG